MPLFPPGQSPSDVGASEPPAPEAPRKPRRWFRRLAVLVLAVGALLALAHLAPVRERVRLLAISAARDRLDTELTIGQLDYNLLTLTFTLRGVVAAAARASDTPFFRADSVTVGLAPGALLGRPEFSSIDLVRPRLALTRDANGRYRLPSARGGSSGRTPRIQVGRLAVSGLDVQIEGAPPMTVEARDVTAVLDPHGSHIQGKLAAVNGARFRSPSGTVVDIGVDGTVGLSPDTVLIGPLTVTLAGSRVTMEGRLPFAPGPSRIDLSLRGSVSLADAARIWPALGAVRGQVAATCTLAGPMSDLVLTFDATATSPMVRGIAVSGASAKGRVGDGAVTLTSATIDVAGGRITGAASLGFGDDVPSTASTRWRGVGLGGLLQALEVSLPFPLAAALDGQATFAWDDRGLLSLRIAAETVAQARMPAPQGRRPAPGEGAPEVARVTPSRATSEGVALAGRSSLKVTGARWVLDLDHQLGDGTALAGQLSGAVNGSRFAATTVGGRLEGSVAASDLAQALALVSAAPAALQATAARVQGDVAAAFELSGEVGDPSCTTVLDARQLHVDGFGDGSLHAEARFDRHGASVDAVSATLVGTTIRASGEMPFDGRPADLPFTGDVVDVAAWLDAVPERWRPSGSLALNGRVTGLPSDLHVDGAVAGTSLAWPFWKPGRLDGDVHLADGRLQFAARVPSVNGTARGTLALSSPMDLDVLGRVDGADLQRLGDIAGGLGAPTATWKGAATLSAHVTGAVDDARPVNVDIVAESLSGDADGHPIRLVEPARVVASSARVATERLRIEFGRSTIAVAGSLPAAPGEKRLHIEADGDMGEWWPAASGRVHAALDAVGSPGDPTLDGEATLSSATLAFAGFPAVSAINARVRVANDTIDLVDARGTWSGAAITAQGQMPVRFLTGSEHLPTPSNLHAAITGLTQTALEPWLGPTAVGEISGQVSAQIDLQASALAIDAVRGTAVITQSETRVSGLTIRQPKPARLLIANGRIQVEDAAWAIGSRTLALSGGVDVRGDQPRLDLGLAGDVDLAVLRVFVPMALSGTARIDARATGEARHPSFSGGATLANVALGIQYPRVAVSGVSGRLTLDGDRLLADAKGNVNGGTIDLAGTLSLYPPAGGARPAEGLHARGTAFLLEWPEGLRSTVDADITYRIDAGGGILSGKVIVEPGAYRRAVPPGMSTSPGSTYSTATPAGGAGKPGPLDATRLDLKVATRTPGLVDNSYARLELEADVTVGGTVGKPAVRGRLRAREDGEVYVRGNVFRIDRGILEFSPDPRTEPSIDLQAQTRRAGYDITLRVGGRTNDLRVVMTSDPPLAQPDLMSLISTGSTSNSMSPSSGTNSQNALVASISSDILGLAGRSVGLDTVRVGELDLDLLGDNVDPQTRLTIGKSIGNWLDLLLSQNLRESGLTWAITVHPLGSVDVRLVSRDSQTNSLEVRHELTFGQPGGRVRTPKKTAIARATLKVASVSVSGGGLPEQQVLDVTHVRAGKAFEFFEWQRDRERIEGLFHERGYLQVQVSATRAPGPVESNSVALRYEVRRGPISTLRITGFELPDPVVDGMKTAWIQSVDDGFLRDDLRERARGAMIDRGYLWPEVAVEIASTTEPREKTADVRITPGPHASRRTLAITGCRGLNEIQLREELAASGAGAKAWREPKAAAAAIADFYRRRGYLAVKVAVAPTVLDGGTARLPIAIDEGPRHVVARIDVRGAGAIPVAKVRQWIAWRVGDAFNPADQEAAARRIETGYVFDGYRDAQATVSAAAEPGTANMIVRAEVQPGVRSVVGDVQVVGRNVTRESIVRHALDLPVGAAASTAAIDRAQRQLYETEAFRSVDIALTPMTEAPVPAGADKAPQAAAPAAQPTKVVVTLEEGPLYRVRYGVQLTDDLNTTTQISDLRLGVSGEIRRRNLFGSAFSGAVGARVEPGNYSLRGQLNIPTSVFWPALSSLYLKQSKTSYEQGLFESIETSLTYQERWRLGRKSELSYGYSYTREDLRFGESLAGLVDPLAPSTRADLFGALAWDARDSILNATRGWFHSSSLEFGAPALASDFSYLRYMFQQTAYHTIGPLVLAGAARTGILVHVTGDDNDTYSLRFRTGGDRTVRGYALDSLSAPGESGAMVGGRALLLLNGELRFPVWRWLKAATFIDAGNAFVDPTHISLHELKVGAGFGIRLDTPYALFRLDVGFPYPQPSSTLIGRWYFSIGQAF
jgi:outer membrane protein assembly factor BamA